MPGRPHHSEKMKSCVDKLIASGKEEDSAYAICTASLQDAGEPIFEGAAAGSVEEALNLTEIRQAGGPGSGNFGHSGRKGEVGGSGEGGGAERGSRNYTGMTGEAKLDKDAQSIGKDKPAGFVNTDRSLTKSDLQKAHFTTKEMSKLKMHSPAVFNDAARIGAEGHNAHSFLEEINNYVEPIDRMAWVAGHQYGREEGERSARRGYKERVLEDGEGEVPPMREFMLRGALLANKGHIEMYDGREHLVVPVIALMEGVIHAVNASTPEFVPRSTLVRAAHTWNGRAIMLGHPVKDGSQISANDPKVLMEHGIGTIFNTRVEGTKLLCDAWIDLEKAERLGANDMIKSLRAGEPIEVSVGAFVLTDAKSAEFNGKPYKAVWREATGDHLALLPGGRGACSIEMGCGTCRAAQAFDVTDNGLKEIVKHEVANFSTLEGEPLDERIHHVQRAIDKQNAEASKTAQSMYNYVRAIYDDHVVVCRDDKMFSVPYSMKDGEVVFDDSAAVEVKQEYVPATAKPRTACGCQGNKKSQWPVGWKKPAWPSWQSGGVR